MTTQLLLADLEEMEPWGMRINLPSQNEYGTYRLIDMAQADIEQHHQVEVLDENGLPLRGVWVLFLYPGGGGPDLSRLYPRVNHWRGCPLAVLNGNARRTNAAGYAQHTFGTGGETILIWDVKDGVLELTSTVVENCNWVRPPVGMYEHTGVKLTFQRQRLDVVPQEQVIEDLVQRVEALELKLGL